MGKKWSLKFRENKERQKAGLSLFNPNKSTLGTQKSASIGEIELLLKNGLNINTLDKSKKSKRKIIRATDKLFAKKIAQIPMLGDVVKQFMGSACLNIVAQSRFFRNKRKMDEQNEDESLNNSDDDSDNKRVIDNSKNTKVISFIISQCIQSLLLQIKNSQWQID